jgi:DNA-binding NtrC family response regulator
MNQLNQLENKGKTNRNGNGSQLAGIETPDSPIATLHSQEDHSQDDHSQGDQLQGEQIHADHLEAASRDPHFSLRSLRAEAEIYAISRTLEYTGWNRRRAAQLLSISYRGILYKIRQHNLTPGPGREVVALGQTVKVD